MKPDLRGHLDASRSDAGAEDGNQRQDMTGHVDHTPEYGGTRTSPRKIAANRQNAKRCTGPKTARGKSRSSLNALKQGVFSTRRLIAGENQNAYRDLAERVFSEVKPNSAVETMLADQIVGDLWRLRRVEQAERAYLEHVRVASLARAQRAFFANKDVSAPKLVETPSMCCRAELVMLDAIVAPERPYFGLEQIRRLLVRDVLRKSSTLAELQAVCATIQAGEQWHST